MTRNVDPGLLLLLLLLLLPLVVVSGFYQYQWSYGDYAWNRTSKPLSDNICRTVDWAELDAALDLVASENQCHEQHGSSLPQAVAGVREAVPVAGRGEAVAGAEVVEEVGVVQEVGVVEEAGEVGVVKEAGDVGVVEEAGDVEVVEEAVGAGAAFVVRGNAVGPRKKRGQRAQKWGLQKEADEGRGGGRGAGAEEVLAPEHFSIRGILFKLEDCVAVMTNHPEAADNGINCQVLKLQEDNESCEGARPTLTAKKRKLDVGIV
eukprot:jgi/Undpi1/1496/HiC_scaffold_11.g04886.m1